MRPPGARARPPSAEDVRVIRARGTGTIEAVESIDIRGTLDRISQITGSAVTTPDAAASGAATSQAGTSDADAFQALLAQRVALQGAGAGAAYGQPASTQGLYGQTALASGTLSRPGLGLTAGVAPAGAAGQITGDGGYAWAEQLAQRFGLSVTSTHRTPEENARVGGSSTSAHLTPGAAADFAGPPEAMRRLAEWAVDSGAVGEVFYDPLGRYWDEGRVVSGGIGGHSDHVHITLARPSATVPAAAGTA